MDEIFNMVYDDVNHSLRVTVLADSAHEFRALWSDTVLARLYATKDGACIYFWMRGVHGDTIAKFEDRNHNVMAYLDSMKEWHASGYDLWTWTAPTPTTKRKIWTRNDTLFWNDSSGVRHSIYPAIPGIGVAPDSAHEWTGAWIDTVFAKHYASKFNLALDFWMRGTRGDTLFKYRDRWGNVVAWGDTNGSSWWDSRITSRADSTDTITASRFKLIGQYNYIPWCTSINTWGAQGFITGWYKDTLGMVGNPPLHGSYIGVSLRQKYFKNNSLAKEVWSIRGGGYKSDNDSTREAWRFPLVIVDPGDLGLNTDAFSHNGSQRIRFATPFYWHKVDTTCFPDSVAWVDTTGQVHTPGIDLLPRVVAPLDSHKIWASEESLWFNDKVGVFHPIWPAAAAGGGGAFGDTNAYYVAPQFTSGYDSIGGHYFSGSLGIQSAINAAALGASKLNEKTVFLFPGYYVQPCTMRPWVRLQGSGMNKTILSCSLVVNRPVFTTARNFSVEDLTIRTYLGSGAGVATVCTLTNIACSSAVFRNFCIYEAGSGYDLDVVLLSTKGAPNDSLFFEHCYFGDPVAMVQWQVGIPTSLKTAHVTRRSSGGYMNMTDCRICNGITNDKIFALRCTTLAAGSAATFNYIRNTDIISSSSEGYKQEGYNSYSEFDNCSFITGGNTDTAVLDETYYGGGDIHLNNCNMWGIVGQLNSAGWISIQGGTIYNTNYPLFGETANRVAGSFNWQYHSSGITHIGLSMANVMYWDTTANSARTPTAREGMSYYKSNATPNDTLYMFMDNGWRNIDRTWATGRDSVLVNQASDTLAITGIQTTSFMEVQLESDPGVNIGSPYHTLTANQDILIWPVACVNKFYYRWRIH
jgi:hypothetical protein